MQNIKGCGWNRKQIWRILWTGGDQNQNKTKRLDIENKNIYYANATISNMYEYEYTCERVC